MNLEGRTCKLKGCPNKFKVFQVSAQHYCSSYHATEDGCEPPETKNVMLWSSRRKQAMARYYSGMQEPGDHKKASSGDVRPVSKEIGIGTIMTQNIKPKNRPLQRGGASLILRNIEKKKKLITKNTKLNDLLKNNTFETKTEMATTERKEKTMQKTESNDLKQLEQGKIEEIQPEISTERLMISEVVASTSLNLLDDAAQHLYELMRGIHGNKPPADIYKYQPDDVLAACACAKNIRELMKLKVDALRIMVNRK